MKEEPVFYERQRFSQSWSILILIVVNALFIYGCVMQLGMGKLWGNNPMDNTVLIIVTALLTLLTVSFFFIHLDTVVNKEGVYIKMFPFIWSFKCFPWDIISKSHVRKYNPMWEYGGWGMRRRRMNNVAYSVSGNRGLQLELTNGKRVLIGTRKPVELEEVLKKLNK